MSTHRTPPSSGLTELTAPPKFAWWAATLALVSGIASAQPGRVTPAFVMPPAPFELLAADPLPHQTDPQGWPYPDYFSEALKLTGFQPGERFRALKLAPGVAPDLLVLPVQTQAFGWTPAFTALLGAWLDRELAGRGLHANRQTDLFDADGPYARRFTDAEVTAFAATQAPKAQVLALYVGRDGAGKAFATLALRKEGQWVKVHRAFAEQARPRAPLATVELEHIQEALAAFTTRLPAMLDEIGLTNPKPAPSPEKPRRCDGRDWQLLERSASGSRADKACYALVMGTLLPDFEWWGRSSTNLGTGEKFAWLAEAWVGADALLPDSAAAVRAVAWNRLEFPGTDPRVSVASGSMDPVARALAQGLEVGLTQGAPVVDSGSSRMSRVTAAAAGLPPFAHAVFMERFLVQEPSRAIDLCSLETELSALRATADCPERPADMPTRLGTRGELALLSAWRIAQAHKALLLEGRLRGMPEPKAAIDDAAKRRLNHPLLRIAHFQIQNFDAATGRFDELRQLTEQAVQGFVQATVDLQRWHPDLFKAVHQGQWTRDERLKDTPKVKAMARDEMRLAAVLQMNGFSNYQASLPQRDPRMAPNFLRPDFGQPPLAATQAGPSQASTAENHHAIYPFDPRPNDGAHAFRMQSIEDVAQARPRDLEALTGLAVLRLKKGETPVQARALIDQRTDDRRREFAIAESHEWAGPAHVFFFSGDLEEARFYYRKVSKLDTYSSSDLQAKVRLSLIDGDIQSASQAAQRRLERYEDDFARRDLAGLAFMLGNSDQAWSALNPRLALSSQFQLWVGAQVGHRIEGRTARGALGRIESRDRDLPKVNGIGIGTLYALRFMTDDREPTTDDLALLDDLKGRHHGAAASAMGDLQALARLKRLANAEKVAPEELQTVLSLLGPTDWHTRETLKPLYAWASWRVSGGKDPRLVPLREADLTRDFDSLLAKGLLLGLEGQPEEALRYLRAARYDLINTTIDRRDTRSAPYMAGYIAWLLHSQTGEPGYRAQALGIAHAYRRTFPYLAWPHALQALLLADGPDRAAAACRAAFLDSGSQFLSLSGLKPDPRSPACRKALW